MNYVSDKDLFNRLQLALDKSEFKISDFKPRLGTGTGGFILEELLGFDPSNKDGPDSGRWEVKFHSGKSPLTLFHKSPEPSGVLPLLLKRFGWVGKSGHQSFRHTIWGHTPRGFKIVSQNGRVEVQHDDANFQMPYWTDDTLLNAFGYKMRRLIVVHGSVSRTKGTVRFFNAHLHEEPRTTQFVQAIVDGVVAIDFDFRATDTNALRDHGTKFRIKIGDLGIIYQKSKSFEAKK